MAGVVQAAVKQTLLLVVIVINFYLILIDQSTLHPPSVSSSYGAVACIVVIPASPPVEQQRRKDQLRRTNPLKSILILEEDIVGIACGLGPVQPNVEAHCCQCLFSICGNDVLPQQSPAPLLLEVMKLRWHTHDRSERRTIERLYAQLCSMYARFVCGGNVFCNPCNQCNQMVIVMGFPFKLLEDASLRTVFFILFPLCPQLLFPGI